MHLTIAAQEGQLFTPSDLARIQASLNTQLDPNHALFLDNYASTHRDYGHCPRRAGLRC